VEIIRSTTDFPIALQRSALTIGNFDGVHRGHALIINRLRALAQQVGGKTIVFTFEPHPVQLLRPEAAPPPLTWTERKAELLAELGVDALIAFPTDEALLKKSPREFFDEIICETLKARAMVEGPNFFFGKNRAGDVQLLQQFCDTAGMQFEVVQPISTAGEMISSSRIRQAIRDGQVAVASQMLTRPYRIRGIVTHGAGRGAKLGFPTANLEGIDTLLPADGIYAGRARIEGVLHPAAIHIGPIPTFADHRQKTEVYILDFEASLYGQTLEVDFIERLRDIVAFDGVEQLVSQLQLDVQKVRDLMNTNGDPC
jgi:riboflavin kinase/FMN adenylyltransferase